MKRIIFAITKNRQRIALAVAAVLLLCLGFVAGRYSGPGNALPHHKEIRLAGYQLINPLLECEGGDAAIGGQELQSFKYKLTSFITDRKKDNWASHVSVYFRDMNNGLAIGIDDKEKFAPASLLKVPLMIAYLKWAEANPGLLTKKIAFSGMPDQSSMQTVKPIRSLQLGKSYTIDELLFSMIAYSDNNAYFLLFANIPVDVLHNVYTDLGLEVPRVREAKDFMSVSEYSAFYRILFNASYLNKDMSEKALAYLTEVDFKDGMVAGLSQGIVAAQKFGETTMGKQQEIKQMHDCGIVYYPGHPYLLCVMTRGESFAHLDDILRGISRIVYSEVDGQYRKSQR